MYVHIFVLNIYSDTNTHTHNIPNGCQIDLWKLYSNILASIRNIIKHTYDCIVEYIYICMYIVCMINLLNAIYQKCYIHILRCAYIGPYTPLTNTLYASCMAMNNEYYSYIYNTHQIHKL